MAYNDKGSKDRSAEARSSLVRWSTIAPGAIGFGYQAGMAELADAADSKSAEGNLMGVRFPLPAPR
jgi:hypothetical protein